MFVNTTGEKRTAMAIGVIVLSLVIGAFIPWPCSKSLIEETTWRINFAKSEQSAKQSILILVDNMFEWEEKVDDFSMHDEWVARKVRANNRLAELSVIIPDFQNQLDECNLEGD